MPSLRHRFLSKPKTLMPDVKTFISPDEMTLNPLLKWAVSSRGAPPVFSDWNSWMETQRILGRRAQSALERLGAESSVWSDYEALALEVFRWSAFLTYGQFWSQAVDPAGFSTWETASKEYERWQSGRGNSAAFSRLSLWIKPSHRGLSAAEKERIKMDLESWTNQDLPNEKKSRKYSAEIERCLKKIKALQQRSRSMRPGVLVSKKVKGLLRPNQDEAAKAAHDQGESGWLFRPGSSSLYQARFWATDPEVRRALWEEEDIGVWVQENPSYSQLIHRLLAARANLAQVSGSSSYARMEMSCRAESSLKKMESFLLHGLKKMRPLVKKAKKLLKSEVRKHFGVEVIEPWDLNFYINWYREKYHTSSPLRKYFPWEATLLKALPDLVRAGGWMIERCQMHEIGHTLIVHVMLRHQTGHRGHLVIRPFAKNEQEDSCAFPIRVGWGSGATMEPIAAIQCNFEEAMGGFAMEELSVLAHEVGHALHYLSITPQIPELDERVFPWDMVEVPSNLLSEMVKDQDQVYRWSSGMRNTENLKNNIFFTSDPMEVLEHQESWFAAWVDLKMHHLKNIPDIRAWAVGERKRLGLSAYHDSDYSVYNLHCWEDYSSGMYAYPWSDAVVAYLLNKKVTTKIKSEMVQELFYQMQENVLRRVSSMSFNAAWKHWLGIPLSELANQGINHWIKRYSDHLH